MEETVYRTKVETTRDTTVVMHKKYENRKTCPTTPYQYY